MVGIGFVIAAAYVGAAQLGFQLAFVAEQVTTVWAPTGIAQAALILCGRRLWPAVWAGAFIANAGADAPLWTAASIASGNTLEAVALASLLSRGRFDPGLSRVGDAARLIVFGAGLTTAISATIGVMTLCLAAVQPWDRFAALWSAWWVGDAMGALVVAPVILACARSARAPSSGYWRITAAMAGLTAVVALLVFGDQAGSIFGRGPLHYLLFPLVVVTAVRAAQPATAVVVLTASAVTIAMTAIGTGPFAAAGVNDGLILLQAFMGVLACTGLLLASAMTDRRMLQQRASAAYRVGEILAVAPDLNTAAPQILRGICESLDWQCGAIWLVGDDQRLHCHDAWSASRPAAGLTEASRGMAFERGRGLPGRVWQSGRAAWIEDVVGDPNFPRAAPARSAGLHSGFGFAIRFGGDVIGVIEFFTERVVSPDGELLETMSAIGSQIGQYIGRKRVEESIRLSEERFRSLAASAMTLTLYEQDRDLRYRWVFPQHPEFSRNNIGKTDEELLPAPEGRRLSELKRAVLESGVGLREEISVTLGETYSYDLMIEPRRDADGQIVGVAGVAIDVTERKRSERLLRESQEQLRDADRRKDEFIAMLAHELRNPLAPIRIGLENLRLAGDDPAVVQRVRPMMERQIGHMVRLVDDLLDVSRITSGKILLQKQRATVTDLVHAAIEANRRAIDSSGAGLVIDVPEQPIEVFVDATRCIQVISNLLHNAAKFTGNRGRIIVAARVDGADAGEHILVLSVSDTGSGISAALLPRVFELFTQGATATEGGLSGLGIGLALAKRIVELHGGTIEARSDGPGHGSEFVVRIPNVAAPPAGPAGAGAAPVRTNRIDRRVLVVDDNEDSAEMVAWLVRSLGGSAQTANDGPTAVRLAAEFAPDIVLLDIGMQGMDGYATCRAIREQSGAQPFIVALTGWGQQRDKARAAEAGFDMHLTKPADPAMLEEILGNPALRDRVPRST